MKHTRSICWTIALAASVLAATPVFEAYTVKATKWNTMQVPFYVNPQNLDVSRGAAIAAIEAGAYAWTNQSSSPFNFYYMGETAGSSAVNNGRNEIFFRNASNGTAIATTYTWSSGSRTVDTDIVFWDGAYRFATGSSGCSSAFYIEDVATHEFGHALGLGHSSVAGATMSPAVGYCAIDMRWLAEDDKQGVEFLYPAGASNNSPVVSISSPAASSSFPEGTAISFSGLANDVEDGNLASSLVWISSQDGQIGTGGSFARSLSPGNHTIVAKVTDSSGVSTEARATITVTVRATTDATGGINLTFRAFKIKGTHAVDIFWSGAASSSVDLYRNGEIVAVTANDGSHTDRIGAKGSNAYVYMVCEAGTSVCSNRIQVTF